MSLRLGAIAVVLMLAGSAFAQAPAPTLPTVPKAAQSPGVIQAPVVLRGKLGDLQVQIELRPKPENEGLEGDYFVFGNSQRILLAGDLENGELVLEESVNGKDISGQWIGNVQGDQIAGSWSSVDGSVSKEFVLRAVQAAEQAKRQRK